MGEFLTELEIMSDDEFVMKVPKGYKAGEWVNNSNGRTGRVVFNRISPDYMSSECYITVSTVIYNPITEKIHNRLEKHFGEPAFDFEFKPIGEKYGVRYYVEEEETYKHYHAFVILNEMKAVLVEVYFNEAFDNAREVAYTMIDSFITTVSAEVSEDDMILEDSVEEPIVQEEIQEDDEVKRAIIEKLQSNGKMTLNQLQGVPALSELGRMELSNVLKEMCKEDKIIRLEDEDNIYFARKGYEDVQPEEEQQDLSDLDPLVRYELEMEQYRAAMKEWKASKNFFGKTDLEEPVKPVKPKK